MSGGGVKPRRLQNTSVLVRDAEQDDSEDIATLGDLPVSAANHLIVERSVRVARVDEEAEGDSEAALRGFVAFDAQPGVVHVTQLAGDREAVGRLLEEPTGFADSEGMAVEAVVPESASEVRTAVEEFGFEQDGAGPRFGGESTRRYRLE